MRNTIVLKTIDNQFRFSLVFSSLCCLPRFDHMQYFSGMLLR